MPSDLILCPSLFTVSDLQDFVTDAEVEASQCRRLGEMTSEECKGN